jgi:hypothetical protein
MTEAESKVVEAALNKSREHAEQHGPPTLFSGCYCRLCLAVRNLIEERANARRPGIGSEIPADAHGGRD